MFTKEKARQYHLINIGIVILNLIAIAVICSQILSALMIATQIAWMIHILYLAHKERL